jgi:hypothetical protein
LTTQTFVLGLLVGCVGLLAQACLLDIPPRLEPLDELWMRRMLEGQYGRVADPDTIESYPVGASFTRYGIEIRETRSTNAGWELRGGLLARIPMVGFTLELFGRETTRTHGPTYTAAVGRDHTYEFFLVVRPSSHARGRLLRAWRFHPQELAQTGDDVDPAILQRSTRSRASIEAILHPAPGAYPRHFVDGYLDFDESTRMATVTVTGLKRPFRDHVDLSNELRP